MTASRSKQSSSETAMHKPPTFFAYAVVLMGASISNARESLVSGPHESRADAWTAAWQSAAERCRRPASELGWPLVKASHFFDVVPAIFANHSGLPDPQLMAIAPNGLRSLGGASDSGAPVDCPVAALIRAGTEQSLCGRDILDSVLASVDIQSMERSMSYAYPRDARGQAIAHFSDRGVALCEWLRALADEQGNHIAARPLRADDDSETLAIPDFVSLSIVVLDGRRHYCFSAGSMGMPGSVADLFGDDRWIDDEWVMDMDEEEGVEQALARDEFAIDFA